MYDEIKSRITPDITHVRIDVGLSYCAPISQRWLNLFDNRLVIGIEPDPDNVSQVKTYIDSERFVLIEGACSNEDGESDFFKVEGQSMDSGCSSLYEPLGFSYRKIKVMTFKFDLLVEFLLSEFSFIEQIKTDTQGHDFLILKSIEKHLSKVAFYDLENGCGGQYRKEEDTDKHLSYLSERGFLLSENSHGNHRFANRRFLNINNESGILD